jgi:hypothetical protein
MLGFFYVRIPWASAAAGSIKSRWGAAAGRALTIARAPHNCILRRGCRQQASLCGRIASCEWLPEREPERIGITDDPFADAVRRGGDALDRLCYRRDLGVNGFDVLGMHEEGDLNHGVGFGVSPASRTRDQASTVRCARRIPPKSTWVPASEKSMPLTRAPRRRRDVDYGNRTRAHVGSFVCPVRTPSSSVMATSKARGWAASGPREPLHVPKVKLVGTSRRRCGAQFKASSDTSQFRNAAW